MPADLINCSWQCTPTGDAVCSNGAVSGNLFDSPDPLAGSSATYTFTCILDPEVDPSLASILYIASVDPGSDVSSDPVLSNNADSHLDTGPGNVLFVDGFESGDTSSWD